MLDNVVGDYNNKTLETSPQLGLGNECNVDMGEMLSGCPDYDCYTNETVR